MNASGEPDRVDPAEADDDPPEADLAARLANIDLNLLPALLALLQERNVTRAAERIGLSQPAMSHALARLRRLLDDELMVRAGQRHVLTPRAVDLMGLVRQALSQVSEGVLRTPDFDPRRHSRTFTLSMTPATAYVVAPRLLEVLAAEAPAVSIELVEALDPGVDPFRRPEVDAALVADIVAVPYPRSTLYLDRWVVVVSGSSTTVRDRVSVADLARVPHVAYHAETVRTAPYIAMEANGIRPTLRLVSSNFLLLPMLVTGTDLLAVVQGRVAEGLSNRFDLQIHDFPLPLQPLGIDVVTNPSLSGDSGLEWLITRLRAELSERR